MEQPTVLYYTFGNHMHWVDMEWLWGYHVLPGSVRDMLRLCRATGVRGNINFDAVGYERLAAEAPDALAELRSALRSGHIEVVGGSYGQPYGLFHGGESNVRQRVYGVLSIERVLGVRPTAFWEEEFDFFPQLPQMLCGTGFRYASLFFQWTWHTPEVPSETLPAVWWEGSDGSRLLCAPRGPLNLHQWPEDVAELLAGDVARGMRVPGILQWLELMPSPDWMCRSELMIPPLRRLLAHPDYEVRPVTLSQYLEAARDHAEVRRYTLDDVFHGLSLGKNGDLFRRLSRRAEQRLLFAESLAGLAGLFGRPYPGWDVYPVWELEEGWRELLAAQHHDNDECEGLCGHVGRVSYRRSLDLSGHVLERSARHLAERTPGPPGRMVVFNPLGWSRDAVIERGGSWLRVEDVPPFGYRLVDDGARPLAAVALAQEDDAMVLRRGAFEAVIDRARGTLVELRSELRPDGMLDPEVPLAEVWMRRGGETESFDRVETSVVERFGLPAVRVVRRGAAGAALEIEIALAPELDAVDITYRAARLPRPDPGFAGALRTRYGLLGRGVELRHDHPYGVGPIRAEGSYRRKYPTGDWMTSPQVFETVEAPFTSLQLLDLSVGGEGLLVLHDGSPSLLRRGERVEQVLTLYDPWDEDYFVSDLVVRTRLVPHGPLGDLDRFRLAQSFVRPALAVRASGPGGDLPERFAPLRLEARGVALTALYREVEREGRSSAYAGSRMEYPYVVRLVEFGGERAPVRLEVAAEVTAAFRTDLLGERAEPLRVVRDGSGSVLEFVMGGREIATLYLDLREGRKQPRDLDARRSVWAQVHRTGVSG